MKLPRQVAAAIQKLNDAGFAAFLVGGGVRDALMGFSASDYDITTSALPEQTEQVFSDYRLIETGLKHGTVTVLLDGMPLEITTFRKDGAYTDFRHPNEVNFTDQLTEDLSRRDFTVNAIAYHPIQGIVDSFGGKTDIDRQIIRCVGSPVTRFREDALRILRAIRFSSTLGFSVEPGTAAAIHSEKNLLCHVSAERIYTEFVKLLCGKNARAVMEEYIDVIGVFLPQALAMDGCRQRCVYHCYDVLRHTSHAVEAIAPEPILRLAAFFHDIGKPLCRTEESDGTNHFYGHTSLSAEIAEAALKTLRADTKTVQTVTKLVQYHDLQIDTTERSVKRALNKLNEEDYFRLLLLKRADTLAQAAVCQDRFEHLDTLRFIAEDILQQQACFSLKQLAINGKDLINEGIPEGKQLGTVLQNLLDAVLDGKVINEKSALVSYALTKNE